MSKISLYKTQPIVRLFGHFVVWVCIIYFRIRKRMPVEIKKLKGPYLVIANHVGHWDPFIIATQLPVYTHFVSSDAAFRNPLARFFLKCFGTIPKMKNVRDAKVIRDMVHMIESGRNIGLFPEAVRNWSGVTANIDPSIVKLIKLLNVPVVSVVLKGMNLAHPRWSFRYQRTFMEAEYGLLLTQEQIKTLSGDEIFSKVQNGLAHAEVEYQRQHMNPIKSDTRAEFLSYALFVCPECNAIGSFTSKRNDFICESCGYHIYVDTYRFFELRNGRKLYFDNIRDWFNWQEEKFVQFIKSALEKESKEPILLDKNFKVFKAKGKEVFKPIGSGSLSLMCNSVIFEFDNHADKIIFDLNELKTINPQVKERLELFYKDSTYRFENIEPGISGLKWEYAVNVIWKNKGQYHKLSSYLNV